MRRAKTDFEQVPLDSIREIIERSNAKDVPLKPGSEEQSTRKTSAPKTEPYSVRVEL